MIITGDKALQAEQDQEHPTDALPPYEVDAPQTVANGKDGIAEGSNDIPIDGQPKGGPSSGPTSLPNLRKSNFIHMRRKHNAINESFVIDPYVAQAPAALMSGAEPDAEGDTDTDWNFWEEDVEKFSGKKAVEAMSCNRKDNLLLETIHASVTSDVWVVTATDSEGRTFDGGPVTITMRSKHSSIDLKLHDSRWSLRTPPVPVKVSIASRHGWVRIALPRSFAGPVTTRTKYGWVSHSKEVAPHISIFSEVNGVRKAFMGDYDQSKLGENEEWQGSSVDVTCLNGRIKIMFDDEVKAGKGVFGKFMSMFSS